MKNTHDIEDRESALLQAANLAQEQRAARAETEHAERARQQREFGQVLEPALARDAGEAAAQKVLEAHLEQGDGVFVVSPLTTSDSSGGRFDCPIGLRLPDAIVARMERNRLKGGSTELARLVAAGVLDDRRVPPAA